MWEATEQMIRKAPHVQNLANLNKLCQGNILVCMDNTCCMIQHVCSCCMIQRVVVEGLMATIVWTCELKHANLVRYLTYTCLSLHRNKLRTVVLRCNTACRWIRAESLCVHIVVVRVRPMTHSKHPTHPRLRGLLLLLVVRLVFNRDHLHNEAERTPGVTNVTP